MVSILRSYILKSAHGLCDELLKFEMIALHRLQPNNDEISQLLYTNTAFREHRQVICAWRPRALHQLYDGSLAP